MAERMVWSDDQIETLRTMWRAGATSGAIAGALKVFTRNAVMGKINRLGLMGCPRGESAPDVLPAPSAVPEPVAAADAPGRRAKSPKAAPAVRPGARPAKGKGAAGKGAGVGRKGAREAEPVPPPAAEPEMPAKPNFIPFSWEVPREDGRPTLLGLKAESCRWPVGDPGRPDFHFCGDRAEEGRPYCTEHCGVAFQKADPNRPRKPWSPWRIAQARQTTLQRIRARNAGRARVAAE